MSILWERSCSIIAVSVGKVPELTPEQYRPRGMTPLLDALRNLIARFDGHLPQVRDLSATTTSLDLTVWRSRRASQRGHLKEPVPQQQGTLLSIVILRRDGPDPLQWKLGS